MLKSPFYLGDLVTRTGEQEISAVLACEQALLFGRAKRAVRERASERRSREGPVSPLACLSRVYFSRYPPSGELARSRRLVPDLGVSRIIQESWHRWTRSCAHRAQASWGKPYRPSPRLWEVSLCDYWWSIKLDLLIYLWSWTRFLASCASLDHGLLRKRREVAKRTSRPAPKAALELFKWVFCFLDPTLEFFIELFSSTIPQPFN